MSKKIKISKGVAKTIRKAAEKSGNYAGRLFYMNCLFDLSRKGIHSPIEQAFYIGFKTVKQFGGPNDMKVSIHRDAYQKEHEAELGIEILPQYPVGDYKADFAVRYRRVKNIFKFEIEEKIVLIECDSQKFHDRSEEERRYEKQRDRFMQCQGFKVFRYTGSELLKDPFTLCAEIINYLTGSDHVSFNNKQSENMDGLEQHLSSKIFR